MRYYAARHIIHRPFVLYASAQSQQQRLRRPSAEQMSPDTSAGTDVPLAVLPQVVIEKCEFCIESCVMYLYNTVEMLDKRSPYLWSAAQSCLACFIVLMLAESCRPLRKFVPPIRPLQETVISKLKQWAAKGSSFEAVVAIMKSLVFQEARKAAGM